MGNDSGGLALDGMNTWASKYQIYTAFKKLLMPEV